MTTKRKSKIHRKSKKSMRKSKKSMKSMKHMKSMKSMKSIMKGGDDEYSSPFSFFGVGKTQEQIKLEKEQYNANEKKATEKQVPQQQVQTAMQNLKKRMNNALIATAQGKSEKPPTVNQVQKQLLKEMGEQRANNLAYLKQRKTTVPKPQATGPPKPLTYGPSKIAKG